MDRSNIPEKSSAATYFTLQNQQNCLRYKARARSVLSRTCWYGEVSTCVSNAVDEVILTVLLDFVVLFKNILILKYSSVRDMVGEGVC